MWLNTLRTQIYNDDAKQNKTTENNIKQRMNFQIKFYSQKKVVEKFVPYTIVSKPLFNKKTTYKIAWIITKRLL